jgi:hypothetical protein
MIITVKHKPSSQWCSLLQARDESKRFHRLTNVEIDIDTSDTQEAPCGGRMWRVTEESQEKVAKILGISFIADAVCEHQIYIGD